MNPVSSWKLTPKYSASALNHGFAFGLFGKHYILKLTSSIVVQSLLTFLEITLNQNNVNADSKEDSISFTGGILFPWQGPPLITFWLRDMFMLLMSSRLSNSNTQSVSKAVKTTEFKQILNHTSETETKRIHISLTVHFKIAFINTIVTAVFQVLMI